MMAGVRRTVKIMTKKDTMIPQMHDWKKHDVIRKRGDLKGATKVLFQKKSCHNHTSYRSTPTGEFSSWDAAVNWKNALIQGNAFKLEEL
jgi:hypothetical protein